MNPKDVIEKIEFDLPKEEMAELVKEAVSDKIALQTDKGLYLEFGTKAIMMNPPMLAVVEIFDGYLEIGKKGMGNQLVGQTSQLIKQALKKEKNGGNQQTQVAQAQSSNLDEQLKLAQLLKTYKDLLDVGAISNEEYEDKKEEIMDKLSSNQDQGTVKPKKREIYNEAVKLKQNKEFDKAINLFESIDGFLDSEKQIEECVVLEKEDKYSKALSFKEQSLYDQAIDAFASLNDYKDSNHHIDECRRLKDEKDKNEIYERALSLKNELRYSDAIDLFKSIADWRDSNKQIEECGVLRLKNKYNQALSFKEQNSFDEAINIFLLLGDYKDSPLQLEECKKLKENKRIEDIYTSCLIEEGSNKEQYIKELINACDKLSSISTYEKANILINKYEKIIDQYYKDTYQKALDYKEKQDYAFSIRTFRAIEDYSDSKQQIKECEELQKQHDLEIATIKRKKLIKRLIRVGTPSFAGIILVTLLLVLTFAVFVPEGKQSKAQKLIDSKKYDEASLVLDDLGNYGKSSKLRSMINAGKSFDDGDFETGIDYIYNAGGTINVSYYSDGGDSSKHNETIKKRYIDNYTFKEGYDLSGWDLQNYSLKSSKLSADISLLAKYSIHEYTITYVLNDGQNNPLNPSTYTIEENFVFLNPTKTGYSFLGWFDSNDKKITHIEPGITGDLVLIAKWSDANVYNIDFDSNGGSSVDSIVVQYDQQYTLPTTTRLGYVFLGWYSGSTKIENSGIWKYTDITVLTAKWTIEHYTITYVLNGGTNNLNNPSSYTIDDSVVFAEPTKTGYEFLGWYDDYENQIIQITKGTTGPLTLNARWFANKYNLQVISEDDTKGLVEILSGTGYSDENVVVKATAKDGYVFNGWRDGSKVVSHSDTYSFSMPTHDYTLIACFISIDEVGRLIGNFFGYAIASDNSNVLINLALTDNNSFLEIGTQKSLGTYSFDNASSSLTVTSTSLSTVTAKYNEETNALEEVTITGASYIKNNGQIILNGAAKFYDCNGTVEDLRSQFMIRYYQSGWNNASSDLITSYENGVAGKAMQRRGSTNGGIAVNLKSDISGGIQVANISYWVYNPSSHNIPLRHWIYKTTNLGSSAEVKGFVATANQWTYIHTDFTYSQIYNYQIADLTNSGVSLIFDNIALF